MRATKREILNYGDECGDSDGEAVQALAAYMEQSSTPPYSWQRTPCCESSRYLYCPKCCRLLVPNGDWPEPLQDGSLQLPFDLHILLEDLHTKSTGVQVKSILDAASGTKNNHDNKNEEEPIGNVKLFNLANDEMPPYTGQHTDQYEGTYLLFPGTDSVPLSEILQNESATINTLVVLDCRWSRSSTRFHPYLASLPKVSLDHPPAQSYYWRWHNTGVGMLSSVEAIYFAAWQITASRGWTLEERQGRLVQLLWLFRIQRAVIHQKYTQKQVRTSNPHVPFTEEAKEFARKLRRNGNNKSSNKRQQQQNRGETCSSLSVVE